VSGLGVEEARELVALHERAAVNCEQAALDDPVAASIHRENAADHRADAQAYREGRTPDGAR
jgi:hypothetical protein